MTKIFLCLKLNVPETDPECKGTQVWVEEDGSPQENPLVDFNLLTPRLEKAALLSKQEKRYDSVTKILKSMLGLNKSTTLSIVVYNELKQAHKLLLLAKFWGVFFSLWRSLRVLSIF